MADAFNILDIPQVQPFQFDPGGNGSIDKSVNLFRGDVNFFVNLVSRSGRNGLDTHVSALYRSNVAFTATHWNLEAPTGILGLGWHLPFDQIVVNTNGSGTHDDN